MQCCVESGSANKTSAMAPATTPTTHHHASKPAKQQPTRPPNVTKPTKKPAPVKVNDDDDDDDEEDDDDNDASNNSEKKENSPSEDCPGVCVSDRIAEYCEAYLITPKLCKIGSKCCVSRDIYPDKVPADLRIPNLHPATNATAPEQTTPPPRKTAPNQEPKRVGGLTDTVLRNSQRLNCLFFF